MTYEKALELVNYAISEIEKEDENEEQLEICYVLKKALENQIKG